VVFDFFCGCSGTSSGFHKTGMDIAFALDIDPDDKSIFAKNFTETVFCDKSITELTEFDQQKTIGRYFELSADWLIHNKFSM
jgi:DNA (cytosine-5)-methyltransferase 1